MRFLTERGQNVNGQPNIIYVSMDNGGVWTPLHEFLEVRSLVCITSALADGLAECCWLSWVGL